MVKFPLGLGFKGIGVKKSPIINNLSAGISEKPGGKLFSDPSCPKIFTQASSWNQIDEKAAYPGFRALSRETRESFFVCRLISRFFGLRDKKVILSGSSPN